jgi:hypothetical protein
MSRSGIVPTPIEALSPPSDPCSPASPSLLHAPVSACMLAARNAIDRAVSLESALSLLEQRDSSGRVFQRVSYSALSLLFSLSFLPLLGMSAPRLFRALARRVRVLIHTRRILLALHERARRCRLVVLANAVDTHYQRLRHYSPAKSLLFIRRLFDFDGRCAYCGQPIDAQRIIDSPSQNHVFEWHHTDGSTCDTHVHLRLHNSVETITRELARCAPYCGYVRYPLQYYCHHLQHKDERSSIHK